MLCSRYQQEDHSLHQPIPPGTDTVVSECPRRNGETTADNSTHINNKYMCTAQVHIVHKGQVTRSISKLAHISNSDISCCIHAIINFTASHWLSITIIIANHQKVTTN